MYLTGDNLERIASALERIAEALEAKTDTAAEETAELYSIAAIIPKGQRLAA